MWIFATLVLLLGSAGMIRAQDVPETLADMGEVLTNTSVRLGNDAQFYCEVIGTQGIGEALQFIKVNLTTEEVDILSGDNEVSDANKYAITDRYRLTIKNTNFNDEAEYRCQLGPRAPYVAYLVVIDPPTTAELYWGDNETWTPVNERGLLTCEAGMSRPPATIRWFRGQTDITALSITPELFVNESGYGRRISMIEMVPQSNEEGILYSCHVDMPGLQNVFVEKINVRFSGGSHMMASIAVLLVAYIASFL